MDAHTLFTYRDIGELRRIQDEREVFTFNFVETKDKIDACPEVCIDISALVYYLQSNKSNIQPVYINFEGITEDTVIISNETVSASALELLPFLISSIGLLGETDSIALAAVGVLIVGIICGLSRLFYVQKKYGGGVF